MAPQFSRPVSAGATWVNRLLRSCVSPARAVAQEPGQEQGQTVGETIQPARTDALQLGLKVVVGSLQVPHPLEEVALSHPGTATTRPLTTRLALRQRALSACLHGGRS